jgi:hypothetical protein
MKIRLLLAAAFLCLALPLAAAEEPSLLQAGRNPAQRRQAPGGPRRPATGGGRRAEFLPGLPTPGGRPTHESGLCRSIQSFQRAISLDANNADAFVGMAMAYLHGGRYGQARSALVEAKRIAPDKGPKIDEVIAWIDQRPTL